MQVAGDGDGFPGSRWHRRVEHRNQRRRLIPHLFTMLVQRLPPARRRLRENITG